MHTTKTMRTIIFLFVLLLSVSSFAQAQTGMIKGTLTSNENNTPLSFSNVAVYQVSDSSLITGSITDADGRFSINIKEGEYYLKISAVGFTTYHSQKVNVNAKNKINDLSHIKLEEDVQLMDAVEVKALRPLVVMEADKMVVSVDGTAMALGASAYEVLEKSPGVFVDQDGNIQLNGRGGVMIMIDGRKTYLSAADLQNMLQGMSADNIKNIEIINNPSSKYDAEGNAGIINITLKKNTIQGINGSVSAGYRFNELHNFNSGLQLNHKKGKWNSFVNADFSKRAHIRDATFYREVHQNNGMETIFDQDVKETVNRYVPAVRLGTDYDFNDRQSIGVMVNTYSQSAVNDFNLETKLGQNGVPSYIVSKNHFDHQFMNTRANLHYIHKLDTNGTKITADVNYVKLINAADANFVNEYYPNNGGELQSRERLENENPFQYDIFSAQTDFEGTLLGQKMEAGLKASHVVSDNNLMFYEVEEGQRSLEDNRSNHFVYTEDILAAYTSLAGRINDNLSYKAGLRAEQTISNGESITLETVNKRDYLEFFPSFFLQQNVSKGYQVNYNYSRRIDRPNYDNLNPFIIYLDPYTWVQGNPYLRPQLTHAMSVTQTFLGQYNLVLNYGLTKDIITEIPIQDPETGSTVFSQQNIDDQVNYSATAVIPVQPFKWWSVNGNITVFHQEFTTVLLNRTESKKATTGMVRVANTFMLPNNLKIELNADYRSNTVWGLYSIEPEWGLDFAVKKSFMDKKLEAALNISDIFRSRQFRGDANYNGNINEINQYFGRQSVGFTLRYRFSRGEEFQARQRNNNLDELNRAGG